jgi:hypothetical protein
VPTCPPGSTTGKDAARNQEPARRTGGKITRTPPALKVWPFPREHPSLLIPSTIQVLQRPPPAAPLPRHQLCRLGSSEQSREGRSRLPGPRRHLSAVRKQSPYTWQGPKVSMVTTESYSQGRWLLRLAGTANPSKQEGLMPQLSMGRGHRLLGECLHASICRGCWQKQWAQLITQCYSQRLVLAHPATTGTRKDARATRGEREHCELCRSHWHVSPCRGSSFMAPPSIPQVLMDTAETPKDTAVTPKRRQEFSCFLLMVLGFELKALPWLGEPLPSPFLL